MQSGTGFTRNWTPEKLIVWLTLWVSDRSIFNLHSVVFSSLRNIRYLLSGYPGLFITSHVLLWACFPWQILYWCQTGNFMSMESARLGFHTILVASQWNYWKSWTYSFVPSLVPLKQIRPLLTQSVWRKGRNGNLHVCFQHSRNSSRIYIKVKISLAALELAFLCELYFVLAYR